MLLVVSSKNVRELKGLLLQLEAGLVGVLFKRKQVDVMVLLLVELGVASHRCISQPWRDCRN